MAMPAKGWDPNKHLRDPIGRFRLMNLRPGWHPYKVGEEIYYYYVNDLNQLSTGSTLLSMSTKGHDTVFTLPDAKAQDRVHLLGNEDGEMMSVSGKGRYASGVINHDRMAPPEDFSIQRGSYFREINHRLEHGESSFGDVPFQTSNRPDQVPYDTLNAQLAERTNAAAFEDEKSKVYDVSPMEVAEKTAEARRWYQRELKLSEGTARRMPVFVYFDKQQRLHIAPAVSGMNDDGTLKLRHSPNSRGGSPVVKLEGRDLTRIARAWQSEGIQETRMCIAGGTNVSKKGRPLNNAVYFRTEFEHPTSHEYQTVWSCIEQKNKGVDVQAAQGRYRKPDGSIDRKAFAEHLARKTAKQREAAAPYRHPKNVEEATTLLHKRWNARTIRDGQVRINPGDAKTGSPGTITVQKAHTTDVYDLNGERIGKIIRDEHAAAEYARQKRPVPGMRPTEADVTYDKASRSWKVARNDGSVDTIPATIDYSPKTRA